MISVLLGAQAFVVVFGAYVWCMRRSVGTMADIFEAARVGRGRRAKAGRHAEPKE